KAKHCRQTDESDARDVPCQPHRLLGELGTTQELRQILAPEEPEQDVPLTKEGVGPCDEHRQHGGGDVGWTHTLLLSMAAPSPDASRSLLCRPNTRISCKGA